MKDSTRNKLKIAGSKGGLKLKEKRKAAILEYNKSPKICLECNKSIDYDRRWNKLCSHSCRACYNNRQRGILADIRTNCITCNVEFVYRTSNSKGKYCSRKCSAEHRSNINFELWKNYETNQYRRFDRSILRQYLIRLNGNKCAIDSCEVSKHWLNKDIVLIVDHIDGDALNDNPNNLRLLCPNCNSQTDTFSGRNKGKGTRPRKELPRK